MKGLDRVDGSVRPQRNHPPPVLSRSRPRVPLWRSPAFGPRLPARSMPSGSSRYGRDRYDEGRPIFPFPGRRYHPDLDGAGRRWHRARHRRQGAHRRLQPRLDRLRAQQDDSDQQMDRLLVAPHSRLTGSQVVWPDLGSTRITAVHGGRRLPARAPNRRRTPTFFVALDPGATLLRRSSATPHMPQLLLCGIGMPTRRR